MVDDETKFLYKKEDARTNRARLEILWAAHVAIQEKKAAWLAQLKLTAIYLGIATALASLATTVIAWWPKK